MNAFLHVYHFRVNVEVSAERGWNHTDESEVSEYFRPVHEAIIRKNYIKLRLSIIIISIPIYKNPFPKCCENSVWPSLAPQAQFPTSWTNPKPHNPQEMQFAFCTQTVQKFEVSFLSVNKTLRLQSKSPVQSKASTPTVNTASTFTNSEIWQKDAPQQDHTTILWAKTTVDLSRNKDISGIWETWFLTRSETRTCASRTIKSLCLDSTLSLEDQLSSMRRRTIWARKGMNNLWKLETQAPE